MAYPGDKYVPDGRLVIDYKTVANINELKWSNELREKVTFIDAYGYMMRTPRLRSSMPGPQLTRILSSLQSASRITRTKMCWS